MSFSPLILSARHWLWPAIALLAFALFLLLWSYRNSGAGPVRWICPILKWLGVAALAFCLLEPLWSAQRVRPGSNLFAIVADNSQSLVIKDTGQNSSRAELLRDLLNPQKASWQEVLEENFDLRRYFFDLRLEQTKDFSELAFDGRASAIGSSLRTLAERFHGRPLAGVLLLTDGNATDCTAQNLPDLEGLPPVYPVVLGKDAPARDIALQQVRVTQSDFEDAPISVQADVAAFGYGGESITVQLRDFADKRVADQSLRARNDHDNLAFRFQFRPEKPGLSFYRLQVGVRHEVLNGQKDQTSEEATLANNNAAVVVDRGHGPYRILYVSGRPNWEFKFLNRALQEDEQLQMVGLIRVAKREPKFSFLGRAGETSNPLYRGFGDQSSEQVERYDQPVLVRLNTRDEFELRSGFPRTAEELYSYHAVILDDLEAEFFSADQAALLQKFVSERGGGLLMLGGMESFRQGNYQRTPIGDMLPVYLERLTDATDSGDGLNELGDALRLNLTSEGLLQSWARLRDNESDEKLRLQGMIPFQVNNRVREIKPGASIIATVSNEKGATYPALVVQRFGRGRTAALTIGDVWRWGMHDPDSHHDMDKSWRQMIRWLVTDVPNRVEFTAERQTADANGAINLQIRVRDPRFQPLDNATVSVEVNPVVLEKGRGGETATSPMPATNSIRIPAEPALGEPGLYVATYVPRLTAGYRATAFVTNSTDVSSGAAPKKTDTAATNLDSLTEFRPVQTGWSCDLAAEEFRALTPNIGLLETIAKRTGGEMVSADQLERLARALPHKHAPVMEAWTFPIWHTPAMFGFALLCFAGEWGLRRWKGMP